MSASYLGSVTVGGAVPGLQAVLVEVDSALEDLTATVSAQLSAIASAQSAIDAQLNALGTAKASIRVPAVADFQAQLDAAIAIRDVFSAQLATPTVYFDGLLAGLGQVQTNIRALLPTAAAQLGLQIDANTKTAVSMTGKIAAVDLELGTLDIVVAAISAQLNAVANISGALAVAVNAVTGAIASYAAISLKLATAGARAFLYTGALSALGASFDVVSGSAGLSGGTNVRAVIVLVDSGDASQVAALNAVFKTS